MALWEYVWPVWLPVRRSLPCFGRAADYPGSMDNLLINLGIFGAWLAALAGSVGTYPRHRTYRRWLLLFFAGGVASGYLCDLVYGLGAAEALGRLFGYEGLLSDIFVTGLVEESSKALVLGLLFAWKKPWDEPLLPMVLALALGAGFGMTENLLVYGFVDQETMVLRSWSNGHGLYAALSASFYGFMYYPGILERRRTPPLARGATLLTAMACHGVFNFLTGFGDLNILFDLFTLVLLLLTALLFGLASPSRAWRKSESQVAIRSLRESLAAWPWSTRNRVRLALYLLARQDLPSSQEAAKVLAGVQAGHRGKPEIELLAQLAAWNRDWLRSPADGRYRAPDPAGLVRVLAASPLLAALNRRTGKELIDRQQYLADCASRGRPLTLQRMDRDTRRRADQLDRVLDQHLARIMARVNVPLAPASILRPDFRQLAHSPLPHELRDLEKRSKLQAALDERQRRLARLSRPASAAPAPASPPAPHSAVPRRTSRPAAPDELYQPPLEAAEAGWHRTAQ